MCGRKKKKKNQECFLLQSVVVNFRDFLCGKKSVVVVKIQKVKKGCGVWKKIFKKTPVVPLRQNITKIQ